MKGKIRKILSLVLSFGLLFQQISFAQVAVELNIAGYLSRMNAGLVQDKFRPLHLRYFSYDNLNDNFKILLDKGDLKNIKTPELEVSAKILLSYFLVGVTLPDDMFWVNLRPDSQEQIIDPYLGKTDVGKIMLEADLQLKKDTALYTSPQTPEGRKYWNKLYKKAEELYGHSNVTIPTLTRPWIVPGEIIVRESNDSAYVYKATLRVMLEQDYLKGSTTYNFKDERAKELNDYSSQLIRELIIPKLTKEVNSSKRYASLRQVYYSLILARWFKLRFSGKTGTYASLINTRNLTNLTSQKPWSKTTYFKQYQKSFKDGEYNIQESVYTLTGQVIRSYFSGGADLTGKTMAIPTTNNPLTNGNIGVFSGNLAPPAIPGSIAMEGKGVDSLSVSSPINVAHLNEADLSAFRMKIVNAVKSNKPIPLDELINSLPQNSALRNALTNLKQTQGGLTDADIQRIIKENSLNGAERAAFVLVVQPGQGGGNAGTEIDKLRLECTSKYDSPSWMTVGEVFSKKEDQRKISQWIKVSGHDIGNIEVSIDDWELEPDSESWFVADVSVWLVDKVGNRVLRIGETRTRERVRPETSEIKYSSLGGSIFDPGQALAKTMNPFSLNSGDVENWDDIQRGITEDVISNRVFPRIEQSYLTEREKQQVKNTIEELYRISREDFEKSRKDNPLHHSFIVLDIVLKIAFGQKLEYQDIRKLVVLSILHDLGYGAIEKGKGRITAGKIKKEMIAPYEDKKSTLTKDQQDVEEAKITKAIQDSINARKEHMKAGAPIAKRLLNELNSWLPKNDQFSVSDINKIIELVGMHDNPGIAKTYETKEFKPYIQGSAQEFLIGKLDNLALIFREADRLWMLSYEGLVKDLMDRLIVYVKTNENKDKPLSVEEQLANNIAVFRDERRSYDVAGRNYDTFYGDTFIRTKTGFEIYQEYCRAWGERIDNASGKTSNHLDENSLSAFRMKIVNAVKSNKPIPLDELINSLPQDSALRNALLSLKQIQGQPTDADIQRIIKENSLNGAERVAITLGVQPGQGGKNITKFVTLMVNKDLQGLDFGDVEKAIAGGKMAIAEVSVDWAREIKEANPTGVYTIFLSALSEEQIKESMRLGKTREKVIEDEFMERQRERALEMPTSEEKQLARAKAAPGEMARLGEYDIVIVSNKLKDLKKDAEGWAGEEGGKVVSQFMNAVDNARKAGKKLVLYSGSSATGKGPLWNQVQQRYGDQFSRIILYTTRPMRDGEGDGIDYHFAPVTKKQIEKLGGNWNDIKTRLINNGWAEMKSETEIILLARIEKKEDREKVKAILGNSLEIIMQAPHNWLEDLDKSLNTSSPVNNGEKDLDISSSIDEAYEAVIATLTKIRGTEKTHGYPIFEPKIDKREVEMAFLSKKVTRIGSVVYGYDTGDYSNEYAVVVNFSEGNLVLNEDYYSDVTRYKLEGPGGNPLLTRMKQPVSNTMRVFDEEKIRRQLYMVLHNLGQVYENVPLSEAEKRTLYDVDERHLLAGMGTADDHQNESGYQELRDAYFAILEKFKVAMDLRITEIINWVKNNPEKNLKGEEVRVLKGTGPEVRVVGSIDQGIAERFGFAYEMDSSPTQTPPRKTGGIDFRILPMTIQPMGSFSGLNFKLPQLSEIALRQINLDLEMQQIRNMVQAGIMPSGERIKELVAACMQKGEINSHADGLLLCLVDILKMEEENASESSPQLKEALVIVDSQS